MLSEGTVSSPETIQMLPQERKMNERQPLIKNDGINDSSHQTAAVNKSVNQPSGSRPAWSFPYAFERLIRPCAAEFIAVAMFVFIGTTTICGDMYLEGVALAHGLTIALLVTATGGISGGHLNPAVTVGVFIGGAIPLLDAALYIVSQLVGGILGAAFTRGVVGSTIYDTCNGGGHVLPDSTTPGEAVLGEILLTYLLVTTVLVSAVDSGTKSLLGSFAIGLAVTVDILAGGTFTGASMNPARSFGPALVIFRTKVWDYHWIYWIGPLLGGAIAGLLYRLLLASSEKRLFKRFTVKDQQ